MSNCEFSESPCECWCTCNTGPTGSSSQSSDPCLHVLHFLQHFSGQIWIHWDAGQADKVRDFYRELQSRSVGLLSVMFLLKTTYMRSRNYLSYSRWSTAHTTSSVHFKETNYQKRSLFPSGASSSHAAELSRKKNQYSIWPAALLHTTEYWDEFYWAELLP